MESSSTSYPRLQKTSCQNVNCSPWGGVFSARSLSFRSSASDSLARISAVGWSSCFSRSRCLCAAMYESHLSCGFVMMTVPPGFCQDKLARKRTANKPGFESSMRQTPVRGDGAPSSSPNIDTATYGHNLMIIRLPYGIPFARVLRLPQKSARRKAEPAVSPSAL